MVTRNSLSCAISAAVMLIAISCSDTMKPADKQQSADPCDKELIQMTFHAVNQAYTKTSLNDEAVLWESSDQVKVLWGDDRSCRCEVNPYNSSRMAEIVAEVGVASEYFAVYPYSDEAGLSADGLTVSIADVQPGSFADACLTVAKADKDNMMRFRHAAAYLEFSTDITGTLVITGGKPLAGNVTVSRFDENGLPEFKTKPGLSEVTVEVKASGTYYIAVLPDAEFDYLSLTINDGEKVYTTRSSSRIAMKPGKLVALGNITERFMGRDKIGATLEPIEIVDFSMEDAVLNF